MELWSKKLMQARGKKKANVIVVGNPTVDGFVYSGFSANNYLQLPREIDLGTNDFEFVIKVRMSKINSGAWEVIAVSKSFSISNYRDFINFYVFDSVQGFSQDVSGQASFSAGDVLYLKITRTEDLFRSYYSNDGMNYTMLKSVTISNTVLPKLVLKLGGSTVSTPSDFIQSYNFSGSIDLLETYLKIEGRTVWKGVV